MSAPASARSISLENSSPTVETAVPPNLMSRSFYQLGQPLREAPVFASVTEEDLAHSSPDGSQGCAALGGKSMQRAAAASHNARSN